VKSDSFDPLEIRILLHILICVEDGILHRKIWMEGQDDREL